MSKKNRTIASTKNFEELTPAPPVIPSPEDLVETKVEYADLQEDETLTIVLSKVHFDDNPEFAMLGLNIGDEIQVDVNDATAGDYDYENEVVTDSTELNSNIEHFYTDLVNLLIRRNATGEELLIPIDYLEGFNPANGYFTGIKLVNMPNDYLTSRVDYCLVDLEDLQDMVIESKGIKSTFKCIPMLYTLTKIDGLSVAVFSPSGNMNFTRIFDLRTGTFKSGL